MSILYYSIQVNCFEKQSGSMDRKLYICPNSQYPVNNNSLFIKSNLIIKPNGRGRMMKVPKLDGKDS